MTNEQFLDEVYKNYNELFDSYYPPFSAPYPKRLTKEEVFNKCKDDPGFVEEYGLKIEERDLTYSERYKLWFTNNFETGMEYHEEIEPDFNNNYYDATPTKVISLTYNNKTIETYYDGRIK